MSGSLQKQQNLVTHIAERPAKCHQLKPSFFNLPFWDDHHSNYQSWDNAETRLTSPHHNSQLPEKSPFPQPLNSQCRGHWLREGSAQHEGGLGRCSYRRKIDVRRHQPCRAAWMTGNPTTHVPRFLSSKMPDKKKKGLDGTEIQIGQNKKLLFFTFSCCLPLFTLFSRAVIITYNLQTPNNVREAHKGHEQREKYD